MISYGMVNLDGGAIHLADDLAGAVRRLEMAADLGIRCALVIEVNGRWSHLPAGAEPIFARPPLARLLLSGQPNPLENRP